MTVSPETGLRRGLDKMQPVPEQWQGRTVHEAGVVLVERKCEAL